jgi:hypothetical protein
VRCCSVALRASSLRRRPQPPPYMEANSQAVRRPGAPTAARSCGSPAGSTCGHLPEASATVENQVKAISCRYKAGNCQSRAERPRRSRYPTAITKRIPKGETHDQVAEMAGSTLAGRGGGGSSRIRGCNLVHRECRNPFQRLGSRPLRQRRAGEQVDLSGSLHELFHVTDLKRTKRLGFVNHSRHGHASPLANPDAQTWPIYAQLPAPAAQFFGHSDSAIWRHATPESELRTVTGAGLHPART